MITFPLFQSMVKFAVASSFLPKLKLVNIMIPVPRL